jgi:hypothetical protein
MEADLKKALSDAFDELTESQRLLIFEVAQALKTPIRSEILATSDLCSPQFVEEFQNRLVLYHALNDDVLKKKTFEFAFARAAKAAGKNVSINSNPTEPGTDVVVDGTNFSLKTEAARDIGRNLIKISKLMEARWIRDCKNKGDFIKGIKTRVLPHLSEYERILMLRAFKVDKNAFEYRLVEIPHSVLAAVENVKTADFSKPTSNNSTTAPVYYNGSTAFRVRFDGSVEKVTIERLSEDLCVVHAVWAISVVNVLESG